jgi:predicted amidophosphoribosyltransferase
MPSVSELSAPYANFMFGPRRGQSVCELCLNFTRGYPRCYSCARVDSRLQLVTPVSYSVAGEQLHHALMGYKRFGGTVARRLAVELAAVLWRFLAAHESCVAAGAGVERFELVTTVPSGSRERDPSHPLRRIVGELVAPTRERYETLLRRSRLELEPRMFHERKFEPTRALDGEPVLLVDDTWTTGASAQSAAAALRRAGSGSVAAIVIGRHVNRGWNENDRRLRAIELPFDWSRCTLCADG